MGLEEECGWRGKERNMKEIIEEFGGSLPEIVAGAALTGIFFFILVNLLCF